MFDYPKDYHENLRFRARMLEDVARDAQYRAIIKKLFHEDVLFAFNCIFWTYNIKDYPEMPQRPFLLYDFQEKIVLNLCEAIEKGEDVLFEKTREMGLSWILVTLFLWYWLKTHPGNEFHIGSHKEEKVDKKGDMSTLIEKARYNLYRIPAFLLPEGFKQVKHDNYLHLYNPETGSSIRGESNNASFAAGGRYKAILFDEFPRWEHTDESAWTSASDATRCKVCVGTPWERGTNCHFFRLKEQKAGKIKVYTILWHLHPLKDQAWYDLQKATRSTVDLAQNIDINYDIAKGLAHFSEYNPSIHRRKLLYIPHSTVYRLWDFGYNFPAVLFTQIDTFDRWLWLKFIMGRFVELSDFADHVLMKSYLWFPQAKQFEDICDPAGFHKSDKEGAKSSVDILHAKKIFPRAGTGSKNRMSMVIRNKLTNLIKGMPALIINEEQPDEPQGCMETESMYYFHRGFQGSLTAHRTKPMQWEKDNYFDHGFDAAGYGALTLFPQFKEEYVKQRDPYAPAIRKEGTWMSV